MDAEIKEVSKSVVYYERETYHTLEINGKNIIVCVYVKQDARFSIHDKDVDIIQGKELLTKEEQEKIQDYVKELD
ncbi:hypothetical protein LCGC14_3083570 [marine sediment metagenome]|uniref:Uncharacterized protein n=1 Tax=marine sediment metagenome TaxID=412755 RepID=A0A0F8WCI9_9ZZZZ